MNGTRMVYVVQVGFVSLVYVSLKERERETESPTTAHWTKTQWRIVHEDLGYLYTVYCHVRVSVQDTILPCTYTENRHT